MSRAGVPAWAHDGGPLLVYGSFTYQISHFFTLPSSFCPDLSFLRLNPARTYVSSDGDFHMLTNERIRNLRHEELFLSRPLFPFEKIPYTPFPLAFGLPLCYGATMREPVIHSQITDELPEGHPLAFEHLECRACGELIHSANNECMQTWVETGRGGFCLRCFFARCDDNGVLGPEYGLP
jgi:hypothetical protein